MNLLRKIMLSLHNIMVFIGKILLVLITVITCIQVFCRYVLDFSLRWSEEVPLIMMVWFGFIAMAIGVRKKIHISIELFFSMFPSIVQKILLKFVDFAIMIFGIIMVYYGWKLSEAMMMSTMPATKMPTGYLYAIVPISGVFVTFHSLMSLLGISHDEDTQDEEDVNESLQNLSLGGKS